MYHMKVTALIPDNIIDDLKHFAKGKNLTESITVALGEWISLKKIMQLNSEISSAPFEFSGGFSAKKVREKNRQR